jgi:hypothetical protein
MQKMSVNLIIHDLQPTGLSDREGGLLPSEMIRLSVTGKSHLVEPNVQFTDNGWSCAFEKLEYKINAQDTVLTFDFLNDEITRLCGFVSEQDLASGFKNFIIPLYRTGEDTEPVCQLMVSAMASGCASVPACLGELESEAEIPEVELLAVWEKYSVSGEYLDIKSMTVLVEDILANTRNKWIHRFQASRVDRVFHFVHSRITPTQLAMIFVKQLDLSGDGKVRWSEFKERFHQSVRMFLKRVETDILNEPSKGEVTEDQHSELEHFFERELRDSIHCLIL